MGKPLWDSVSNLGLIPRGIHTNRSLYLLSLLVNLAFHLSEVGKWVPENSGPNSLVMDDEGCSHQPPLVVWPTAKYLVGHTHISWVNGTLIQMCIPTCRTILNWPNFINRLCLHSKLFSQMYFLFHAHAIDDVMKPEYLKF